MNKFSYYFINDIDTCIFIILLNIVKTMFSISNEWITLKDRLSLNTDPDYQYRMIDMFLFRLTNDKDTVILLSKNENGRLLMAIINLLRSFYQKSSNSNERISRGILYIKYMNKLLSMNKNITENTEDGHELNTKYNLRNRKNIKL